VHAVEKKSHDPIPTVPLGKGGRIPSGIALLGKSDRLGGAQTRRSAFPFIEFRKTAGVE
jgi:hypothetical protein